MFLTSSNRKQICEKCSTYQPINTKTIICIDYGKEIEVKAWDVNTKRCKDCQLIYRKEYKKIWYKNRVDRCFLNKND
ncbi:MAG: hypothetical protein A2Y17_06020 [Clostridiales bacterium GWF2_38_85]|nr:MAG: hypothetical protein A2Y17_06020 [Clostridiales bacterium GWF2_38_85]